MLTAARASLGSQMAGLTVLRAPHSLAAREGLSTRQADHVCLLCEAPSANVGTGHPKFGWEATLLYLSIPAILVCTQTLSLKLLGSFEVPA